MPANLPPQYYAAKKRFDAASDPEEKLEIIQEMLAIMPKHKGTDKLRAEVRSKMATLRKEIQKSGSSKRRGFDGYHIESQGAAVVGIIGSPNVGKSSIIKCLTNALPEIAPYPFTTGKPVVGMMPYEDINIQLIDTPPISSDYIDKFLPDMLRRVDLILLIVDIGSDAVLEQTYTVLKKLKEYRIILAKDESQNGDNVLYKKTLMVANKEDSEDSADRLEIIKEFYGERLPIITISAEKEKGLDDLKKRIYESLEIIRIYTKSVGKKADMFDPVILTKGSTVLEAAAEIHKEFYENLKFARIWGDGQNKYDGQHVSRDHPLEDGNVVEFHIDE
ncbi:TGS domain-containing protein [Candidatus Poribacteria bacterium]|nr:TGS domain-containing protein [Candidatus Poribacteria bacterium]